MWNYMAINYKNYGTYISCIEAKSYYNYISFNKSILNFIAIWIKSVVNIFDINEHYLPYPKGWNMDISHSPTD